MEGSESSGRRAFSILSAGLGRSAHQRGALQGGRILGEATASLQCVKEWSLTTAKDVATRRPHWSNSQARRRTTPDPRHRQVVGEDDLEVSKARPDVSKRTSNAGNGIGRSWRSNCSRRRNSAESALVRHFGHRLAAPPRWPNTDDLHRPARSRKAVTLLQHSSDFLSEPY
jgi:hypothetical protein